MMRLDKFLAHAGLGTRKEVKQLIRSKRIKVNDQLVRNDDLKIDEHKDVVMLDDEPISYEQTIYMMLNKPAGVISATFDEKQATVMDCFDEFIPLDAFPVGRLDIDTEGLLLITNDGALAHELLAPKKHVDKVYYVKLKEMIRDEGIKALEAGIQINDEECCAPASVKILSDYEIELTIHEGKFHQVKRMMHAIDNEVVYLKRLRMGTLQLDETLKCGEYRPLTKQEINDLKNKEADQ